MTSTPSRTRKLFLLLCSVGLLAASFVLIAPRTASALLVTQSCDCVYPNGEQIVWCNGQVYREGTISGQPMCSCEPCS